MNSSSFRISNEEEYHELQVEANDNLNLQLTSIVKSHLIDEDIVTGECQSAPCANDLSKETLDDEMNCWLDENDVVEDILHVESFQPMAEASEDENVQSDRYVCLDKLLIIQMNPFRQPYPKEIAAALIILKNRHRLSNSCVNHICQLWKHSKIENVPKNYKKVVQLLMGDFTETSTGKINYICSICKTTSTSSTHCVSSACSEHIKYTMKPFEFVSMPILPQLRQILARENKLNWTRQSNLSNTANSSIEDIYDGDIYQRILQNEKDDFLSLVMNIDGAEISASSNSSLWIATFVINEIHRKERFKIKNVIVGGILTAPCKPSRDVIRTFMQPSVDELIKLEKGTFVELNIEGEQVTKNIKVFLIGACCDKPAQCLLQGVSEPIGAFGCGRCEIEGDFTHRFH